jgi:hypothetical protein
MQPSTSSAPSTASASAPVERRVLPGAGLRATPTTVPERVVEGLGVTVVGTPVVGVVGVVGVVELGALVVGATVPG